MKEEVSFIAVAIFNIGITFVFLLSFYLFHNRKKLQSEGFNEEYIRFIRKIESGAAAITWTSLMIIQAVTYFIVAGFVEKITFKLFIKAIFLLAITLTIIIRFLIDKYIYKEQKKLAISTGSEIVVDFNYKILHMIFKPILELISTVFVAAFTFLSLRDIPNNDDNYIIYFYLIFIWYFYISMKSAKNMIMPQFESTYRLNAKLLFLFHIILIMLVFVNSMAGIEEGKFDFADYLFAAAVTVFLIAKFVLYLKGYMSLNKSFSPKKMTS